MLAHRRADVRELNQAARALLLRSGQLGEDVLVAGGREFRPGDRVVCRRNDRALGVRNGTRARVHAVDPARGIVTPQVDAGPRREVPMRYAAEHVEHGYALTGHAAQGASVERAFVLVRAEGALAEWGYVAASRARAETRLYAVGPELDSDVVRLRDEPMSATRRLAGAFSRAAAEPAALERIERRSRQPLRPGSPARGSRARSSRASGCSRQQASAWGDSGGSGAAATPPLSTP